MNFQRIIGFFLGSFAILHGVFWIFSAPGSFGRFYCRKGCELEKLLSMFFGADIAKVIYGSVVIVLGLFIFYISWRPDKPRQSIDKY